jgi:hypothetical protein
VLLSQVGMTVYAAAKTGHWIQDIDPSSLLKLSTAAEEKE